MGDEKLVSIIIPVYNAASYIRDCFQSVEKQTYTNWECLLVDDGSTDGSSEICDEITANNAKFRVIHQSNMGICEARNTGLSLANGEFVMFLDDDDEITATCVETLLTLLLKYDADISCGRANTDSYRWNYAEPVVWRGETALKKSLSDDPLTYTVWGKLFSKKIIETTRFNKNWTANEDSMFVFHLCTKSPVFVATPETVYIYNFNPNSASHAEYSNKYTAVLKTAEEKEALIKQHYPHLKKFADNYMLKSKMQYLKILCTKTGNEYKEEEERLIKEIKCEKCNYISGTSRDDRWLFEIDHNLYFLIKVLYRLMRYYGKGLVVKGRNH